MKRNFALATLALVSLAALAAFTPAAYAAQCSIANVAGSYGYDFSGFVSPSAGVFIPAAAAGRITFDGHGNISAGKQTRVVAGSALDETYSGTYTVNADCTGSFTVLVQPDTRSSTVKVVWTENTNSVSFVFATPGFTLSGSGRRIVPRD